MEPFDELRINLPMKLNQGYLADKNLTSPLFRKSGTGKRGANLQFFK
jgi:hypothetical protein